VRGELGSGQAMACYGTRRRLRPDARAPRRAGADALHDGNKENESKKVLCLAGVPRCSWQAEVAAGMVAQAPTCYMMEIRGMKARMYSFLLAYHIVIGRLRRPRAWARRCPRAT